MKYQRGFTFLELIIVLAIVSIVAAGSVVIYGRLYGASALHYTADGVIGQLQKARLYAMEGKQKSAWGMHANTTELILFQGDSFVTRNPVFDETFPLFPTVTVSGFSDLVFSRITGTPSATPTILLISGNNSQSITVNSMGVSSK